MISDKSVFRKHHRGIILLGMACLAGLIALPAPPAQETRVRIGTNVWPGYEPLYLARALGHYDDTPIRLVELPSASDVIRALRSGTLEGAAVTLDEALILLGDDIDLKTILIMDYSDGGDALLAKPDIASLADLRGKRIAVEHTAVGAILLDAALDAAGLTASDVVIAACPFDQHLDCYRTHDAVVTFDPIRVHLLRQDARQLFDSSQIPGRIIDVLVVLTETTRTHERALVHLVAGYFKATKYLADRPDDASQRMAPRMGLSPSEVLDAYNRIHLPGLQENHAALGGQPPPLEQTARELADFMLERYLLRRRPSVEALADGRFLPDIGP